MNGITMKEFTTFGHRARSNFPNGSLLITENTIVAYAYEIQRSASLRSLETETEKKKKNIKYKSARFDRSRDMAQT